MNNNYHINDTLTPDLPINETNTLTIEKLRTYKGLETLTDEQSLHIIQSITSLCQIAVRAVMGKAA